MTARARRGRCALIGSAVAGTTVLAACSGSASSGIAASAANTLL
jgi:hypothetical protein